MTFHVCGNRLVLPGRQPVEFDFDIRDVAKEGDVFVVLLNVPADTSMTENVFGVSYEGAILWQIERIPATASNPVNRYTAIQGHEDLAAYLYAWNGTGVKIDVRTGKVLDKWVAR